MSLSLLLSTFAIGVLLQLGFIVYAFVRSPLRELPGPWHTKVTDLVLKYNIVIGRRLYYIDKLHEVYGPVVRLGPNEADFMDLQSFKTIHKITGGFRKASWYATFRNQPVEDLFTFRDPQKHAMRRKLLSRPFSNSSIRSNWEAIIRDHIAFTVSKIKADAEQGKADVLKWWTLMAYDIITTISFGENPGMVAAGKLTTDVEDLETTIFLGAIRAEMPRLYDAAMVLPLPVVRKALNTWESVAQQGYKAVENANSQKLDCRNIFSNILEESKLEGGRLSDLDTATEANSFIIAGSGTTAVTLTYTVWRVLQQPKLRSALEAELMPLSESFQDSELEKLPVLNAVLEEALRLHGAAPGSLSRIVPEGGAMLGGYHIAAGTKVCTQSYSFHRDSTIFPDPYSFDHTRWLSGSPNLEKQNTVFHPFGAGATKCLGIHLARMELRIGLTTFIRSCAGVELADSTTPESMFMEHYSMIRPIGQRCEIVMGPSR